jgi:peptidoglycan-N-acetylglucosamine deacetylase
VGAVRRLVIVIVSLVALFGVLVASCGDDDSSAPVTEPTTTTAEPATTTTAAPTTAAPTTAAPTTAAPTTAAPTTAAPTTAAPTTAAPTTAAPTTVVGVAVELRRGPTDRRAVALTFDAGSDTGYAARILDILAEQRVPASFGLTGVWTDANPALVARMVREGHLLINHSYDHPSFTGYSTGAAPLSRAQRLDQLRRTEESIRRAAGVDPRPWFRPPYGDTDAGVLADIGAGGYRWSAMWTVDSLGWKGIPAAEIRDRCLSRAEPGAIYLFHVGSASADAEALPAIIAGLRGAGYEFVTLSGMV